MVLSLVQLLGWLPFPSTTTGIAGFSQQTRVPYSPSHQPPSWRVALYCFALWDMLTLRWGTMWVAAYMNKFARVCLPAVWTEPAGAVKGVSRRQQQPERRWEKCRRTQKRQIGTGLVIKGLENHYFMHETKRNSGLALLPLFNLLSMYTKQFQIEDLLFISQIFLFIQEALPQMHCISLGTCSTLQMFFSCNKYLTFRKIASKFTQCRAHSLRLPSKHPEVPGA